MAFMPDAPIPVGTEVVCIGRSELATLSQVAVAAMEDDATICLSLNATLEEVLVGHGGH